MSDNGLHGLLPGDWVNVAGLPSRQRVRALSTYGVWLFGQPTESRYDYADVVKVQDCHGPTPAQAAPVRPPATRP